MTYFGDDEPGERDGQPGRGARIATWVIGAFLVLITVNIGIAAFGGRTKGAPAPIPGPVPTASVPVQTETTAPTAAAPSTPESGPSPQLRDTGPVRPDLPLPVPTPGGPPTYPDALGAVTADGDVVLIDADTAAQVQELVAHESDTRAVDISWDAARNIMYFSRGGPCPTIWRYRLEYGRAELFAGGEHPVVSPDGIKVAVIGTGCGAGGPKLNGVAVYSSATGNISWWIPQAI